MICPATETKTTSYLNIPHPPSLITTPLRFPFSYHSPGLLHPAHPPPGNVVSWEFSLRIPPVVNLGRYSDVRKRFANVLERSTVRPSPRSDRSVARRTGPTSGSFFCEGGQVFGQFTRTTHSLLPRSIVLDDGAPCGLGIVPEL